MKKLLIPLLLCAALLTGCSGNTQSEASLPDLDSMISEETQPAQKVYAGLIYYATDHGTVDAAGMTSWKAELETMGNTWKADALASVPAASDTILVLNAPTEDINQNDLNALDALFDAGGHMLLVLPANESEVRYKYLERALEEFCIRMDYDLVTDPAEGHMLEGSNAVLMSRIGTPDGMSLDEKYYSAPLMLDNTRSFSFFYNEGYGSIKMDGFLETDITAVGTPCGGTEDDPETFEGKALKTMLYARDEDRGNASVVALGSGSFLTDAKYSDALSEQPLGWVTATIPWMIWLNNRD
ncbi:MAG: hypothetical protein K5695_16880 [Oscillospiraceae bacterium]|nr:hypothetical protein [Oscillospiraceae bacterium]